jgi:hypothetical protein
MASSIDFHVVTLDQIEGCNIILGTAHFIKTVEDLFEAIVSSVPNVLFGLAFCEASGPCLIRYEGNDNALISVATDNALKMGCGHSFIIYLKNAFPINILNQIKCVPEVCTIHAATANPLQVLIAETHQGRGIIGVIDGQSSQGVETENERIHRIQFIRNIGYKVQ